MAKIYWESMEGPGFHAFWSVISCYILETWIGERKKRCGPPTIALSLAIKDALKELGHHISSKCTIYSTIQVTAPTIL